MQISVVMSVYNGSKFLKESIESILCQTCSDFEFIIIDDASTDDSAEIIKSYSDYRIVFISNDINRGLTYNLIKGVSLAKGKYIVRMDSDDIAICTRLEKQIEYMDKHPDVDICGTWAIAIDNEGRKKYNLKFPTCDKDIKESLIFGNCIIHPSVIIRKDVFRKHNYDVSYRTCQDYRLWSECVKDCTFANIDMKLLKYRISSEGISRSGRRDPDVRYKTLASIYRYNLSRKFSSLNENEIEKLAKLISELYVFNSKEEANEVRNILKLLWSDLSKVEKNKMTMAYYNNSPRAIEYFNSLFVRGLLVNSIEKLKLII